MKNNARPLFVIVFFYKKKGGKKGGRSRQRKGRQGGGSGEFIHTHKYTHTRTRTRACVRKGKRMSKKKGGDGCEGEVEGGDGTFFTSRRLDGGWGGEHRLLLASRRATTRGPVPVLVSSSGIGQRADGRRLLC